MFSRERYNGGLIRCSCGNIANWVIGGKPSENRAKIVNGALPWYICNACTDNKPRKEPKQNSAF